MKFRNSEALSEISNLRCLNKLYIIVQLQKVINLSKKVFYHTHTCSHCFETFILLFLSFMTCYISNLWICKKFFLIWYGQIHPILILNR